MGKKMKAAAARIAGLTADEWSNLSSGGHLTIEDEPITAEDVIVNREAKADVVIEVDGALIVALDNTLDDALILEGLAREFTSHVQNLRRNANFEITDRIRVCVASEDERLNRALLKHKDSISEEVLATHFELAAGPVDGESVSFDDIVMSVRVERA